jgi:uracil permease
MSEKLLVGIQERPKSITQWLILSLQHVFAMFGATVLVPILTGLDVGVALVASGVGTLIYIACTKGKVPVYLGSSFAYITAIATAGAVNGYSSAYVGLMLVGIIYVIVATVIRFAGSAWIKKILPPVVIGPMIMIIGLGLANVAIGQAGLAPTSGDPYFAFLATSWKNPIIALVTFATVVFVAVSGKGFFRIVPFLIAVLTGYILAVILGVVDLSVVWDGYSFFQVPAFQFPFIDYSLDFDAIWMFAPIAFVTIAEHIGDHTVLGEITGKDFIEDPGLENTIMGDGIATFVSAVIGGPANTTYGENTGVVAMTRVGSVYVTGLAAIFAISLGFLGWIQAFINSIPSAVIGGMTIVLYGLIAGNGVRVIVKANLDLSKIRNIIIIATMLVVGLGGAQIVFETNDAGAVVSGLQGMSLAAIVGVVLNLVLPEVENAE